MSEKDNRRGFSFRNLSPEELLGILTVATLVVLILYQTLWLPSTPELTVSYTASQPTAAEQSGQQPETSRFTPSAEQGEEEPKKVFINQATAAELETLPGIGPAYAKRILEYRETYGKITSPEALLEIQGIGEKTVEKLLPYLDFS